MDLSYFTSLIHFDETYFRRNLRLNAFFSFLHDQDILFIIFVISVLPRYVFQFNLFQYFVKMYII